MKYEIGAVLSYNGIYKLKVIDIKYPFYVVQCVYDDMLDLGPSEVGKIKELEEIDIEGYYDLDKQYIWEKQVKELLDEE